LRLQPIDAPSPDAVTLRDEIVASRSPLARVAAVTDEAGRLLGPFACLPYSPAVGNAVQRLGTELRHATQLPPAVVEAVILTVAVHWKADYEWYAHAAVARSQMLLTEYDLALMLRKQGGLQDAEPETAASLTRELLETATVSTATWASTRPVFTDRQVVEIVLLAGYYGSLAMLLKTFEPPLPDGVELPFQQ
jgi:4-carboxymuconolactone decarboxylase